MRTERKPSDQELSRPAMILTQRFVQRWDLYARQLDDGRCICIHKQLNVDDLFAHLRGEITLRTYLLNKESQARFIVFDDDTTFGLDCLASFVGTLAEDKIPSYLESSRRGCHLCLFLAQLYSREDVRKFVYRLIPDHDFDNIEVFPNQDELRGGPGFLIRLPFGVHRLSGHRYGFHRMNGKPLGPTIKEQIYALSALQTVPDESLESYMSL